MVLEVPCRIATTKDCIFAIISNPSDIFALNSAEEVSRGILAQGVRMSTASDGFDAGI